MEINEPLVDTHLKPVPGVSTLSGRSLTGGDAKLLGGETDGSLAWELLVKSTLLEVSADLFEILYISGGEGDANPVHNRGGILHSGSRHVFLCVCRHFP